MDALEKLELVLSGEINKKKAALDIDRKSGSVVYTYGLENQINALEWALNQLQMIKRNAPSMSDEIVLKMYGESNVV
jgi:hypothetical protein